MHPLGVLRDKSKRQLENYPRSSGEQFFSSHFATPSRLLLSITPVAICFSPGTAFSTA